MTIRSALEADPERLNEFALAEALGCPMWVLKGESLDDFQGWIAYFQMKKEKRNGE